MGRWGRGDGHAPAGTRVGPVARVHFFVAHKFPRRHARPPGLRCGILLAALAARLRLLPRKTLGGGTATGLTVLLAVAGCGGGGGVSEGATVSVYAVAPACAGAKRVLARHGARAGEVRVRLVCLRDSEEGKRWTLAAVGANARRATENSTTVAYIADRDPTAARFSRSILESAGVAQLPPSPSGAAAMAKLLDAIRGADPSSNLRESVEESLGGD